MYNVLQTLYPGSNGGNVYFNNPPTETSIKAPCLKRLSALGKVTKLTFQGSKDRGETILTNVPSFNIGQERKDPSVIILCVYGLFF